MRLARPLVLLGLVFSLLAAVPASAETVQVRYYERTAHTVSGAFLAFLAERGDPDLLGAPLTESIVHRDMVVQFFERGALQLEEDMTASLMPVPQVLVPQRPARMNPPSQPSPLVEYFPQTGMLVGFAILDFYRLHGGVDTFGQPIAPEANGRQWFERAELAWDATAQQVTLTPLGGAAMRAAGLDPEAFKTQWIATFEETSLLTDPTLESSGPGVGPYRPFLHVGSEGDFLKVWDPGHNRYGWLSGSVVGPGDPPVWLAALENAELVGLPARIAKPIFGEFPDPAPELQHNQPAWIAARISAEDGAYYLDEEGTAIPDSIVRLPTTPPQTYAGKWIDADLNEPVLLTAYEGEVPVYAALAVKGTGNFPTQRGYFPIQRRVANETMSSATIGIPLGTPGSYHLTGVLFTQYFTSDGAALHYNYWKSSWGYAGSHGCLGMNYDDSEFFWNWATVGVPVVTRY